MCIWRGRCKANPDNFESAELNTPASFYRQLAPVLLLVVRQRLNNLWTRVCVVYLITVKHPAKAGCFIFFKKRVAIFCGCAILFPVMRDTINLPFNRDMAKNADFANWMRQAQMKEWKAIPEAERPTWEQFKRGLKKKKNSN